jgi:cytochrome bd-type quinol oxidase subunit 2
VIQIIGNTLVVISVALCWIFVVLYHALTGGTWRRSAAGRHLMVSMATFGTVLTSTAPRVGAGPGLDATWFQIVRVVVFAGVPVVFAWRIVLLIRAQRRDEEGDR